MFFRVGAVEGRSKAYRILLRSAMRYKGRHLLRHDKRESKRAGWSQFWFYGIDLAAASMSSDLARTRMSSVKFAQRTVPVESTRNSAGREMSVVFGPPPACSKL